jgi:hypothetical protein
LVGQQLLHWALQLLSVALAIALAHALGIANARTRRIENLHVQ